MANTFTFANQTLTDADIFGGINFVHDLNTGDEFSIGNTASASVNFVTDKQLPLYSKDQTNGTFTWTQNNVSRGRFFITEVTKTSGKYEVTAYDAMILLETSITALSLTFPLSVATAAAAIASFINCTTYGTINNSTMEAAAGTIDDTTTCRQLLGWVAEASGCSVKIDGADQIVFMYYPSSGITVSASAYKEFGLDVADYTCAAIDNVTICDMAGMTAATAGAGTNSLFIQGNPFLYEATNTEAAVILGCVDSFVYAPFKCEMFEENGLEVGVIATFGSTSTLVMHLESGESGAIASAVGSDTRAEFNKSLDIIANEALATATETNLHFWYESSGSDAGAHIAEVDRPTFQGSPSGGNILIDAYSLDVRDGMDVLATFGAEARIGKEDKARTVISPEEIYMVTDSGAEAIHIYGSGSTESLRKQVTVNQRITKNTSQSFTLEGASGVVYSVYVKRTSVGAQYSTITLTRNNTTQTGSFTGGSYSFDGSTGVLTITAGANYDVIFGGYAYTATIELPAITMTGKVSVNSGDINLASGKKYKINNKPLLAVGSLVLNDNISISGGGYNNSAFSELAEMSGYTPLGVVGFWVGNGTSSGSGASYANVYQLFLDSDNYVNANVRNISTNTIKIKITAYVLYMAQ